MSRISRRRFLQAGMASAGAIAITSQVGVKAMEFEEHGRSVNRTTTKFRQSMPSVCQMCPSRCGILAFVEHGKVVKIQGNPKDPNSRGRLCSKGQAGVNIVNNPDRLLSPMKRTGPRGQGNWATISWDEAFNTIGEKLRTLRDQGKTHEFVFQDGVEDIKGYHARFLNAYGTPTVLSHLEGYNLNKRTAHEVTSGAPFDVPSATAAHYILNFGSNPYESHQLYNSFTQRIIDARTRGAKLVTFDVRLSNTAGRSDEWIPLRPGTDAIVALAMANVIFQEGLADREFLDKWTNYPSDRLAEHLSKYTPEEAEKVSGVSAADIKRIAIEFGLETPAVAISGNGVSAHQNGTHGERSVALLNAVTGNIDISGGACLPRTYSFDEPDPKPPVSLPAGTDKISTNSGQSFVVKGVSLAPLIGQKKLPVSFLMTYQHNPAYSDPDSTVTGDILRNEELVPFFVAVDSFMSETAVLADIVLPSATYLESWGLESPPALEMVPFISYRQPAVSPRGESKTFAEICTELAKRIGGGMEQYFTYSSMDSYLGAVISKIEPLQKDGGLAYLKANGVWFDKSAKAKFKIYETEGFNTPSKKYEIFSEQLQKKGFSPLPVYEAVANHKNLGADELHLITFRYNVHSDWRTAASWWLSEISHENGVWINPETAEHYGIHKGDAVKVTSSLGSIVTKAHITHGIHPKVVAISDSLGHWEYGRVAKSQKFKSEDPNTHHIWWDKDGNGAHPFRIMPVAVDSIGGGQGWMDTTVTISKSNEILSGSKH